MLKKSYLLLVLMLGACGFFHNGPEIEEIKEPRYGTEKPILLKVSRVDVISEFSPTFKRPHVEHLFPVSLEKTAKTWARDRLEAVDRSSDNVAEYIIKDASVTEDFVKSEKVFQKDSLKYKAVINVVLKVSDPKKLSTAQTEITAYRELTIPADSSITEKEAYWNSMVQKLFDEYNAGMTANINHHLNMYVKGSQYIQEF